MNREATIDEWSKLYLAATKIKELKPWEYLWDMDLISIKEGEDEDAVFISVLGKGGSCYGITIYEGYEGLNDFLMLTLQESMNLSTEYAMFSQNNLTCYWGNREELSDKQRKIIKDLGYKYRGENQWLYFMSFAEGYYPCNLDRDEVLRMTHYMELLADTLEAYQGYTVDSIVDFEAGYLFSYSVNIDAGTRSCGAEPVPFTSYQFGNLILTDNELVDEMKKVPKTLKILEADIVYLGASVNDKKYIRPANPRLCMICDVLSETILKADMTEPDQDINVIMAENIVGFILKYGAPKEIRVSNVIVESVLDQICKLAGIKLRRVKKLSIVNGFVDGMRRFR